MPVSTISHAVYICIQSQCEIALSCISNLILETFLQLCLQITFPCRKKTYADDPLMVSHRGHYCILVR